MANFFDEETNTDLFTIPLKGKYLQEFVLLNREIIALSKSSPVLFNDILKMQEAIVNDVSERLRGDSAEQFGIDFNDLKVITSTVAPNQELGETTNEVLKTYFMLCLALQEHKENDCVAYIQNMSLARERAIIDMAHEAKSEDINENTETSIILASICLPELVIYDQHKARKSLVTPMESEILFGKTPSATHMGGQMGTIRKALATLYDYDLTKHADHKDLLKIERTIFQKTAQKLGLPCPKSISFSNAKQ